MQSIQSNGTFIRPRPAEIPTGCSTSVLRALPCNPTQLFVYWELPKSTRSCTSISLSLIESDASRESDRIPMLEIAVPPTLNSYYVNVPFPGLSCRVQLDATFANGKHIILLSEQRVHLPPPVRSPDSPVHGPIDIPESQVPPKPSTGIASTTTTEQPVTANHYSSWSLQKHSRP